MLVNAFVFVAIGLLLLLFIWWYFLVRFPANQQNRDKESVSEGDAYRNY